MRDRGSEARAALAACRDAFTVTAAFSFFVNLLMLVSPLYMMQVYNRVLPSRSGETLLVLTLLAAALIVVMGLLEAVRSRILVRVSARLDQRLSERALSAAFRSALRSPGGPGIQGLRDFDTVRQFLAGNATFAFFDAPWTPIFIAIVFLFHPLLGVLTTVGAATLCVLALANEIATRKALAEASHRSIALNGFVDSSLRNAETLEAMGMFAGFRRRWAERRRDVLRLQLVASDRAGAMAALTKSLRLLLQVALLAAGAHLAIAGEVTPGAIIATSILVGRALAPVEMAIGTWKQFVGARDAYARLTEMLAAHAEPPRRTALPRPAGHLSLENVTVTPPGANLPALRNVRFALPAGQVLGIMGPSGAGKSTLARAIVGVWQPDSGEVRLDGADLQTWNRDDLGPDIGYLPQDVELFDATVAENIARFGQLDSKAIVDAARRAGVHEIILRLAEGYETVIGPGGCALSGGQRQRVALARALYGEPRLVVLDEPNSNLDEAGERALADAIREARSRGATVVVVSHRASVLDAVDRILVLADGAVRVFGPRDEALARLARPTGGAAAVTTATVTPLQPAQMHRQPRGPGAGRGRPPLPARDRGLSRETTER